MQLNSLSTVGIATQVWAQAARTLTADPATDAGAATFVWTHAARLLTGLSSACITGVSSIHQSLANAAIADDRPAANVFRIVVMGVENPSANNFATGMYDGVTMRVTFNATSGASSQNFSCGYSTFGPAFQNNSGAAQNYDIAGLDLHQ